LTDYSRHLSLILLIIIVIPIAKNENNIITFGDLGALLVVVLPAKFPKTLAERPTTTSCRVRNKFIQWRRRKCMDADRFSGYTRAIRRWLNSILPCRERRNVVRLGCEKLRR